MRRLLSILTLTLLCVSGGGAPPTQTSGNPECPVTGTEVWTIAGKNYDIEGTALLTMGNGQTLFIVKALCASQPDRSWMPVARALAKYAIDHGYHKKVRA